MYNIFLGIFLGFIFGLVPNFHLNSIIYLLILFSFNSFFNFSFFICFAISNTLSNLIPLCLFGIPNSENILMLFPTHKYFKEGKAKLSILISLFASNIGVIFSILFLPLFFVLFYFLQSFSFFVYFFILFFLIVFIFQEKNITSKLVVLSIIIYSGTLGIFTLKYNYFLKSPLFIMVFSLFAIPQLLISLFSKKHLVFQKKNLNLPKIKDITSLTLLGTFTSLFILLVPSFSSSQASLIVSKIKKKLKTAQYLFLYSLINMCSLIFCIFLVIFFNKSRLGYFSIILNTIQITNHSLVFYIIIILLSTLISSFFIFILQDYFLDIFNIINVRLFNFCILLLSIIFIVFFTNLYSLFFIFLGTLVGFLPLIFKKNRVILIAYIMIPTLLYYI